MRLRGELLLSLNRIAEAKEFFKSVLSFQKFTWARVGLVEALIHNSEFSLAKDMLELMLTKSETRLVANHLLGKLELHMENYQQAQLYITEATALAPRNIDRQHTLVNLTRLNHDYEKSYSVNKEILKYAKHSIHDSPEIYLNLARAGVDYALTLDQSDLVNRLTRQSQDCLKELRTQFPDAHAQEQLDIVNARIHYLKDERNKALRLVEQLNDEDLIHSIDDALDKAKVLHELGFHQRSSQLFDKISKHSEKYQASNTTLNMYLKQEQKERDEIKFGPKDLNNNAVKFYQQGRYIDALQMFNQAFRIMPKNASIALNLLQTIFDANQHGGTSINTEQVNTCVQLVDANVHRLDKEQSQRYEKMKPNIETILGQRN